jgi:hypothetical protein
VSSGDGATVDREERVVHAKAVTSRRATSIGSEQSGAMLSIEHAEIR